MKFDIESFCRLFRSWLRKNGKSLYTIYFYSNKAKQFYEMFRTLNIGIDVLERYLREKGYSEKTIRGYKSAYRIMRRFIEETGVDVA